LGKRLKKSFPETFTSIAYLTQLPDQLRLLTVQLALGSGDQESDAGNGNLQALLLNG
jgi:hypothetical protein